MVACAAVPFPIEQAKDGFHLERGTSGHAFGATRTDPVVRFARDPVDDDFRLLLSEGTARDRLLAPRLVQPSVTHNQPRRSAGPGLALGRRSEYAQHRVVDRKPLEFVVFVKSPGM